MTTPHKRLPKTTEGWLKLAAERDKLLAFYEEIVAKCGDDRVLDRLERMRDALDIIQPYAKEKYGMPAGIEDLVEQALSAPKDSGAVFSPMTPEQAEREKDYAIEGTKAYYIRKCEQLRIELEHFLGANATLNDRLLAAENKVLNQASELAMATHNWQAAESELKWTREGYKAQLAAAEADVERLAKALYGRSFLAATHRHLWTQDCTDALVAHEARVSVEPDKNLPPNC